MGFDPQETLKSEDFENRAKQLDSFLLLFGSSAILLLNISALTYIILRLSSVTYCTKMSCFVDFQEAIPFTIKFFAPYAITCSTKLLFDVQEIEDAMVITQSLEVI